MVDSKDSSITVNDDWEDAVDSGEFEKQLKQQIKQRVATQVCSNNSKLLLKEFRHKTLKSNRAFEKMSSVY